VNLTRLSALHSFKANPVCRMVPLGILLIVIAVLFEVYKTDFERWAKPLTDWLRARSSWSWTLPVAILIILSFPPLFGHEVVLLIVGVCDQFIAAAYVRTNLLTLSTVDLSSRSCAWYYMCRRYSRRSRLLVSLNLRKCVLPRITNVVAVSSSSSSSPRGWTRKSKPKSSGQQPLGFPKKLASRAYWSFATALSRHVSYSISTTTTEY
jgi:hypothetical protein